MATAYTPGLKVTADTIIRKMRRLPIKGEVLVKEGDRVSPQTIVARAELPGKLQTVKVTETLGVEPVEIMRVMRKQVGDKVEKDEIIAETKSFFGLFKGQCSAPVRGTIEYISEVSGFVGIRQAPVPVEVKAYIEGKVSEVIPQEGVIIETRGALIQGIFGVGGERYGILKMAVDSPGDILTEDVISADMKGKVLVGGALVTREALEKAKAVGICGLITGGIIDIDLIDFLGYDIGVAITGNEDIAFTLILTEGFGKINMADRTFRLLKNLEGREASISGATQIRAGVIRPEVIVPRLKEELKGEVEEKEFAEQKLEIGSLIRFIRQPYFGLLGKVTALPSELVTIETGAKVRVLEAELQDGRKVIVPRANVERIEE